MDCTYDKTHLYSALFLFVGKGVEFLIATKLLYALIFFIYFFGQFYETLRRDGRHNYMGLPIPIPSKLN